MVTHGNPAGTFTEGGLAQQQFQDVVPREWLTPWWFWWGVSLGQVSCHFRPSSPIRACWRWRAAWGPELPQDAAGCASGASR